MAMIRALKRAVARRLNFTLGKTLNGRCFRIPMLGGLGGAMRRHHEPWMLENLIQIEKEADGCFVDVGVNLGQTLLAVKSIRSDWEYIGFEPNPYCVFYTMNLVKLNTLEGCTIFPFGIGETTVAMDLRLNSLTGGEGSIVAGFRSESDYKRRIKVPILGAEFLPGELLEHKVGVLKVDVEGGELDVFRAMTPVLRKHQPLIISELLPIYDTTTEQGSFRKERQDALTEILHDLGYGIIRLHLDGSRERLEEIEVHSEIALTNYLFAPVDRASSFLSAS
ncbi:MAG: FkbM family methyltransferase [Roseibacillus sp.]|nr:FkbM family methyltransferase [Roseibacillus sp.]